MRAVDRVCSWLGARTVVEGRPGMGWMLLEVVPIITWSRITGAFNLEGAYYLVTYLLLLGASETDLVWLPLLFSLATIAHAGIVVRRRDRRGRLAEPRATCLVDTTIGRSLWLLAYLWPLLSRSLDLGWAWAVGGSLLLMVLGQTVLLAGASAWATWIKAIVPERQRGPFFAWRNVAGFLAVQATLLGLTQSGLWPDQDAGDEQRFTFYTILFVSLTVLTLLMVWPLSWAPRIADEDALRRKRAAGLRQAIRRRGPFWRYSAWNAFNVAASLSALTYLQPLLTESGVTDRTFATWDGLVRIPALLLGILFSGALIHRVGAWRLVLLINLLLIVALGAFSAMPWTGPGLLPVAMACDGLARGAMGVALLSRLHQVIPHGDARFPALFMGLGGVGGLLVAGLELPLLPLVEQWWAIGESRISVAWCAVTFAAVLRLVSTPLLMGHGPNRA